MRTQGAKVRQFLLIVVRTGQATPDRTFDEKLWQLLLGARPSSGTLVTPEDLADCTSQH